MFTPKYEQESGGDKVRKLKKNVVPTIVLPKEDDPIDYANQEFVGYRKMTPKVKHDENHYVIMTINKRFVAEDGLDEEEGTFKISRDLGDAKLFRTKAGAMKTMANLELMEEPEWIIGTVTPRDLDEYFASVVE